MQALETKAWLLRIYEWEWWPCHVRDALLFPNFWLLKLCCLFNSGQWESKGCGSDAHTRVVTDHKTLTFQIFNFTFISFVCFCVGLHVPQYMCVQFWEQLDDADFSQFTLWVSMITQVVRLGGNHLCPWSYLASSETILFY